MSDNIKVAIKVRPLIDREKDDPLQWNVCGNTITPTDTKRRVEAGFQFDHIFDMQKRNPEIFNTVVKPIVNSAVNGFNGTVFAYGQTGSGKTYTMMGTETEFGIIPQAINYMFEAIESKDGREFLIRFSYFEIYNERINDLMEVENTDLKIKEENGRVFVNKCSEKITKGAHHMLTAMKLGEKNRSIGETNMNERSSRSHTIFRITIESREISSDSDGAIQIAQLNLVDLAGSERASQTGATGDRFKEGKHINLSLSTLGLVIKQLSETQDKDKPNFVNFRDSKLTRILQASLGGNSLTAIICTVTPATFEETYCTLSFASRAKSIKNKPKLNEDLSEEALLKRYRKQIVQLTKELEKANQTIKDRQNNVLAERVELLKEYIVTGNRKTNFRRRSCPVKFNYEKPFFSELPTIRESVSPETPKIDKIKRRQSIMQNANSSFESFETALADFELDLLQSELPSDENLFINLRRKSGLYHRVKFNDNVHVLNETGSSSNSTPTGTPRRLYMGYEKIDSSPGTPKSTLRERLKTVLDEHMELEELTVLEKQCQEDAEHSTNVEDKEKTLQFLKRSLEDTSLLYTDVNKKYSDLQTEHSHLVEECGELRKQVESLSAVQARLGKMEIDNKELNIKLNTALKKQAFLENENVSQAFQMESLQTKFKAREKELESSLQLAWKGCDPAQVKETANEILQLQSLVRSLTEEVEVLKLSKSSIQESNPLTTEIESLKLKLEETNQLLKESDLEKASLGERLDSISERLLMRSKIEEYDRLLETVEDEKVLSIQRFDELSKEIEGKESGLEISALQKAVDNMSSHLTELERGNVNMRKKFSVYLACVEFLCQQNSDKKLLDDGLDVSLNFENWKKTISYNEREKSDIICGLQKFREGVIRKSKSMESKLENEFQKVNIKKETLKEEENSKENLEVKENTGAEISNLIMELKQANFENERLRNSLGEMNSKILEAKKFESSLESKLAKKEAEFDELNSKVIELEVENLEMKSNLAETLQKLKDFENGSPNLEKQLELNAKLEQLEDENSEMKSQLLEVEEKLSYSVLDSSKLNDELDSALLEKDAKVSELNRKIKEIENKNKDLRLKLEEAENRINDDEILEPNNQLEEKEIELNNLKLKFEGLNLENMEIKFKLVEAEDKIKNYEALIQASKAENSSIEDLESKLRERENKINELVQKSKELEQSKSELNSKLQKTNEMVKHYEEVIESLKLASEDLKEQNANLKSQLEEISNVKNEYEDTLDSRLEENEAVISQLTLRIKEIMDENFQLKSQVEDAEEKCKHDEITIESLNSDVQRLNTKLQEKEIEFSHLNMRFKELQSINNSFTKLHSMNSTSEEPFADLKSGEDFVQSYVAENDAIKKRLEDFEKNVSIFRENVDQQKTFVEGLESVSILKGPAESSPSVQNKISTPRKFREPESLESPKTGCQSLNESDYTSIFTNDSYFEKMEVSGVEETVIENETQNESQEMTAPSVMINILKSNSVPMLKRQIKDLETRNVQLDNLYKELIEKVNDKGSEELANAVKNFKNVKISLEIENARLSEDLQQKINESEEVKNGIHGLKMDIEQLQQTIYLLNSENVDLTSKLNAEKENIIKVENSSQTLINELKAQVAKISDEKTVLEKQLSLLDQKVSSLDSTSSDTSDVELKSKLTEYHQKVIDLETENRRLSDDLMGKIKELDSINECKALQYDHECKYKEKNCCLVRENQELKSENAELSDDLMKHIDECEILKHELETTSKKLEIYEQSQSISAYTDENVENILQEKTRLEAEVVELKSKVENPSINSSLLSKSLESPSRRVNNSFRHDENVQALNSKIKSLQEQVEHLTLLNRKLSDLKLSSCTQCAHLKELNENRRALKLEVKSLNNKLENLQVEFREKCASTEALRMKANEELNTNGNVTLNGSICEGMNVTLMEENIRTLSHEKEVLKEEYDKLSNLYQEKCSDLEMLQESSSRTTSPTSVSPTISKKEERVQKVATAIKLVGADLQEQKEKLSKLNCDLQKYKELKDQLKIADEKVLLLESDNSSLYHNIETLNGNEKTLKTEKLNLEVELETLKLENQGNKKLIGDLQKTVDELDGEKKSLNGELEVAKEEKDQLLARQKYEDSNREVLEATLKEYRESIEDSERRIKEISSNLNKLVNENQNLKDEITRLQSLVQENIENIKPEEGKKDSLKELDSQQNSSKELECAKSLIIKEMKSLTAEVPDPSNKSISDIFLVFLKAIISKEHEIIKTLKDGFEQEKQKLKEAKEQSEDAEKRTTKWAKSLENDMEKLQSDLTLLESKNLDLQKQLEKLEEIQHENLNLREKIGLLESDYSILQAELDKYSKKDMQEICINEEKERIQASIKDKEMEFKSKMKLEKEEHNKKLGELTYALRTLETKNLELKKDVDGFEANEKQLKNIIDIKNNEISKNSQKIKDLQMELEQLVEMNNNLNEEILKKNNRIEEITSLLKKKCDVLSEYKTKLETLMPEYNNLHLQIEERKLSVEKYKEEIENQRIESSRELNLLNDKVAEEEIKSAGLCKQLNELKNKNGVLLQEIETTREKCMELEAANEKLMKIIRNSTSNTRVEKEIEDLVDENRTLEKNLEGASNRISDLMDSRMKAMQDLADLKGEVEKVKIENEELKKAVDAFKLRHNYSDIIELRGKYEELLQEKNRINLELEEKKLTLAQRDKKLEEISEELRNLKVKNEELDKEAEELAEVIRENETDVARLTNEKYDLEDKCKKEVENLTSQLKHATSLNTDLRAQIEIIRRTELGCLQKENKELKEEIVEVQQKLESKSSKSMSPLAEVSQRKKRRSDLFNQKRNLEEVSDSGLSSSSGDCACSELRKTVLEFGKEIAMKNGIIAALNVQIQSESFPYQVKCKELQDQVVLQKNKTRQLLQEISNLKKAMMNTSSHECEVCKKWKLSRRNQSVQCNLEEKVYLSGTSSGIVGEFKLIEKLEKEKALMKQLCRSRLAQIKQLETKVAELSGTTN